ncbi:MAG TPA: response regulator [Prolixibacteraceae bacterium]|nr:response regulator [Prolixibacteraceae bacterium]
MKKLKIEIQVTILTICIAVAVAVSGYLAYQSFSQIVDSIHKEARPDLKLLLIKDIASDLNEVENTVRLYSLTGDATFINPYRNLNVTIQEKLSELQEYAVPESNEIQQINSIRQLVNRKLLIWDKIRALHHLKGNTDNSFSELYSKIDTAIVEADTIIIKPEAKKAFLKRLFGKRDTNTRRAIIIDKSKEKEIIKQEIAGIEKQITHQTKTFQAKERTLLEQNIQVTKILNQQIEQIETSEQKHLETKTIEADFMAAQTYRRLAIFTVAAIILLISVLILFFRNLQRNRTYQQVLTKAKSEAESLTKAKEIFVATVSHEMRTPVNVIFGLTEQMLQKATQNEVKADLEIVYKSAAHLISLVNDTLDFSKIESQTLKIEQIDFLPDEIFQEVYTLHKNSAHSKGIELIFNKHTDENLVLKGDPVRLKQVLINLITNAIKFTNHGHIELIASCEEISGEDYLLHIEVSDTGIGITKEDQHKIFEEFVQLDSDLTQKQRGTGLGLAIVKKLIDLQNGKIELESIRSKGSRFRIQIPYQKGHLENVRIRSEEQPDIPASFNRLHFLIVDDEEFNLYLLKNILKKWGVSYTEAHNGKEATEFVRKESFDLILMDIRMPVMDGYEAANRIMQDRPSSRIIALTATNKPDDRQKNNKSGIQTFLQKPFTESALYHAVIKSLPAKYGTRDQDEGGGNSPVNLDDLRKLTGDDPAFFNEMLRIFVSSSENGFKTIRHSFQISDWDAIAEAAHKLAAPSKHIQNSLYDNLKNLESEAKTNKDCNKIKRLVDSIAKEITHINAFINQKLTEE